MGSPQHSEAQPSPHEAQKIGQQAQQGQQRSDDHTNSARAGEPNRPDVSTEKAEQKGQPGTQPRPAQ